MEKDRIGVLSEMAKHSLSHFISFMGVETGGAILAMVNEEEGEE